MNRLQNAGPAAPHGRTPAASRPFAAPLLGFLAAFLTALATTQGAELLLDFSQMRAGAPPPEFQNALTGGGPPADWRLVQVPLSTQPPESIFGAPQPVRVETVLAQLSEDRTDERFPLLIYEPLTLGDFTATLTFRTVRGRSEQMAGLAFRLQNPTNYYVIRASSLGSTFRFYKVVNGVRSDPAGPEIPIPSGEWHTLEVTTKGNAFRFRLNGEEVIPPLNDSTFATGRLALWTKSDSVSHFRRLQVVYDPLRTLPQLLVERAIQRFPRLLGITVSARESGQVQEVASSIDGFRPRAAGESETQALEDGTIAVGKARDHVTAVFPLKDHNGDPLFAVRLDMRTFAGQTQGNIAARGRIIVEYLQEIVAASNLGR